VRHRPDGLPHFEELDVIESFTTETIARPSRVAHERATRRVDHLLQEEISAIIRRELHDRAWVS